MRIKVKKDRKNILGRKVQAILLEETGEHLSQDEALELSFFLRDLFETIHDMNSKLDKKDLL